MRKTLLLLLLCLCSRVVGADFVVDGIKYSITSTYNLTVSVNRNNYSGDMAIPNKVAYEDVVYSVTSIGDGAFEFCHGLTSITIPSSVTSIGDDAFFGCDGLTSITIPEGVTSIGEDAFSSCSGLTSITIPSSVTSIGDWAFLGCRGLTSITIPSSVTSIGDGAFLGCRGLTSIVVESGNSVYDSRENCNAIIETSENVLIAGCQNTIIPSSVTSIGNRAFSGCRGLTSIMIPGSVTSIGDGAFEDCSGLTSITIPSSVTSIGGLAFYYCSGLTSITIPSSVTSIGRYAFSDCSGLTSITIPSSVTSIGENAFLGCSGLTSITIPSSVTSIGNSEFYGCSGLTSIVVENGNSVYDSRENCNAIIKTSENTLIAGCQNTIIPSSVTSIGNGAFYGCSGLTSITIPSSVTSIGKWAFEGCSGLTSITIPSSVTSIGDMAFKDCSGLTSITIPSSVTSIGDYAFWGCSGLTSLVVRWDEIPSGIDSTIVRDKDNVKLYVPVGTKATYKSKSPWNDFMTIIECEMPQDDVTVTDVSAIDNVMSIEPFEATQGKEVVVPLLMKNTAQIRGFQFDMQLPFGVTVVKDDNERLACSLNSQRLPENSAHNLTVNELEDRSVRFLCGSQYDETFTGTKGEIVSVRLRIDPNMLTGLYKIVLKNVKLSETNIDNYYLTETVQTALKVIDYTPGDISGDGEIDVTDYIGVANHIMGNTPDGFVSAAADVNKDQVVDVSDYIGIANLILYNSLYGNTNAYASRRYSKRKAVTDVSTIGNVVYVEPFTAEQGEELQLKVKMKNTAAIRGFQFDLYLPDGMTAKKYDNGRFACSLNNARRQAGDEHTLTLSEQPDGGIRFLCGSQYDETFTGSDGEIATLTVNVAADMEENDYPVFLRHIKLTETDISKFYQTEEIETAVTVTKAENDGRMVLSETVAPEASDGTVNVRVRRTINADEWSTICLPFAMTEAQVKAAFGNDVQLADATGYEAVTDEMDDEIVTGIRINFTDVDAIEENHPYIIKVSSAISSFDVDGVTVNPASSITNRRKKIGNKSYIVGNYAPGADVPEFGLFLSGNRFWYSTGATKLKAFRAYFDLNDVLTEVENAAARISFSFDDNETTGITDVKAAGDGKVYDLRGQVVKTPAKGIYVKDGKKVVIK